MKKIILLMCGLFLIVSCATDDHSSKNKIKVNFDKEAFDNARELWQEQNLQNYTYTYEYFSSNGPYNYNVVVDNGVIISEEGRTIDNLFANIESTYKSLVQEYDNKNADLVTAVYYTITYNSQYHYPERFSVSYSYSELPPPGYGGSSSEITNFHTTD